MEEIKKANEKTKATGNKQKKIKIKRCFCPIFTDTKTMSEMNRRNKDY